MASHFSLSCASQRAAAAGSLFHRRGALLSPSCSSARGEDASSHGTERVSVERQLPLPNALWLLDSSQANYFDVRGHDFIIQRAESSTASSGCLKSSVKFRRTRRSQLSVRPEPPTPLSGLIVRAARSQPTSLVTYNGYPVIDVTDSLTIDVHQNELVLETEAHHHHRFVFDAKAVLKEEHSAEARSVWDADTCAPAPMSQWGLVPVAEEDGVEGLESEAVSEQEPDVYVTSSMSPRRTHMVGFTCLCCGARCHNKINPTAFHDGTLAARCGKCMTWHKIKDKFNLFGYDLRGDEFVKPTAMDEEDLPPALRLPLNPFYWQEDRNNN